MPPLAESFHRGSFPRASLLPLILLLIALWPVSGLAVVVLPEAGAVSLDGQIRYLEEPEGGLRRDELRAEGRDWKRGGESRSGIGLSESAWWFRVSLANPVSRPAERLLEIGYPHLDRVDVHVFDGQGHVKTVALGDQQSYGERPHDHQNFVVPLHWQAGQVLEVFVRVESSGAIRAPMTLWTEAGLIDGHGDRALGLGLVFGALAIVASYNLLLFSVVRDRSYLYYVGAATAASLFLATLEGLSFRYLWPDAPEWDDRAIPVLLALALAFAALLSKRILRLDDVAPMWARIANGTACLGFAIVVAALVLGYGLVLRLAIAFAVIAALAAFAIGVDCWRRRVAGSRLYACAVAAVLAGFVPLALTVIAGLSADRATTYGPPLGAIAAALLFSFALAERIADDRRRRDLAQARALSTMRRSNAELEARVRERTREKESIAADLQRLSTTDELTGLRNRRHLVDRLHEEWARGARTGRCLAVVIADIDRFKQVNDDHGHPAGDACLIAVAHCLSGSTQRPADLVTRYGGEEFCIVLPDTDLPGALVVAEQLRSAVEAQPVTYGGRAFGVTVSVGLAATVPDADVAPDTLLARADRALYEAKRTGRNRVCSDPGPQAAGGDDP